MQINELQDLIADALGVPVDSVTSSTKLGSIEEWDSLGHISILSKIDEVYEDITERVPEFASCISVEDIFNLLNQNGF